jgi:hypothetical protein
MESLLACGRYDARSDTTRVRTPETRVKIGRNFTEIAGGGVRGFLLG